jgi:murein DD-endopeptidase MepM/ murein hydrolase activator NlpD
MRSPKFRYNKETCQYEPARVNVRGIVVYCLGILVTSGLLFSTFLVVYDRLTVSDVEAALRKENNILDKHQILLSSQLVDVEATLAKLKSTDESIYLKLFDEKSTDNENAKATNKNILLADAGEFTEILDDINHQSSLLHDRSAASNTEFDNISISKSDVKILNALPTLQPITNTNLDLLVSGFGIRINPFHKGKHKHPGIDFAAARGTDVYAAGPGQVVDINRSDLQAGYGNSIDIDHGHGFITRYAHLEEITVRQGQKIIKAMKIGTVGSSGGSIAPHLHYEVIHDGENVDPLNYMIEGLSSHDYNKLMQLGKKQNQSLD